MSEPEAPPAFAWRLRDRTLTPGAPPLILGIVNVTPDSFSDGGRFAGADEAVAWGLALAEIVRAALAARRRRGPATAPAGPEDVLALRAAPDPLARYLMAWLASILLLNLLTSKHLVHVQLMMLPALAVLGGLFATRLWRAAAVPGASATMGMLDPEDTIDLRTRRSSAVPVRPLLSVSLPTAT